MTSGEQRDIQPQQRIIGLYNVKFHQPWLHLDGVVVSVSAWHVVGIVFVPWPGHTKDHHKIDQTASLLGAQALW